jgi:hypothetical protein
MADINVEEVLKKLTISEKVDLLAGKSARCRTRAPSLGSIVLA